MVATHNRTRIAVTTITRTAQKWPCGCFPRDVQYWKSALANELVPARETRLVPTALQNFAWILLGPASLNVIGAVGRRARCPSASFLALLWPGTTVRHRRNIQLGFIPFH